MITFFVLVGTFISTKHHCYMERICFMYGYSSQQRKRHEKERKGKGNREHAADSLSDEVNI